MALPPMSAGQPGDLDEGLRAMFPPGSTVAAGAGLWKSGTYRVR